MRQVHRTLLHTYNGIDLYLNPQKDLDPSQETGVKRPKGTRRGKSRRETKKKKEAAGEKKQSPRHPTPPCLIFLERIEGRRAQASLSRITSNPG